MFFFFFKQKTAYEMRISDWSSDVCSSDLLLTTTDPWFRPNDCTLGPDGALYVTDFYNRIIGHYEVPLTHPGRDRERGRIWKISYTGKPLHAIDRKSVV